MPEGAPRRPPAPVLRSADAFTGLVVLPEAARIDGRVVGRVLADGLVWIGASARLRARIEAREVVLEGRVEGPVSADRVELGPGAQLRGDLQAGALTMADGAVLEGRCLTLPEGGSA